MFLDNFDVLISKIILKKIKKYQLQHVKNQLILYIEKNSAQRAGKSARIYLEANCPTPPSPTSAT